MIDFLVTMQRLVSGQLDNAIENGYMLDEWDAHEIAADLADYSSDFEGIRPVNIIPFITCWKEARL